MQCLSPSNMLIDDARTRELLSRIVFRLSADSAVRDDLMQEALVHLWLLEERRPDQRQSWYLQSCKFHLQNYISAGRSVDSPKRSRGRMTLLKDDEEFLVEGPHSDMVVAQVCARD